MKNKYKKLILWPQNMHYFFKLLSIDEYFIWHSDTGELPVNQSVDIVSKIIQKHDLIHSYHDNITQSLCLGGSSGPL